jgi:hypothetical protein
MLGINGAEKKIQRFHKYMRFKKCPNPLTAVGVDRQEVVGAFPEERLFCLIWTMQ